MHVNGISVAKNYVIIKNILLIALMLLSEISFSQTKAYIRRAENAIYKGNYDLGTKYYLKAVALDSNNYAANLGAGITMAYLENYEEAFPYLEKALGEKLLIEASDMVYCTPQGASILRKNRYSSLPFKENPIKAAKK